MQAPQTDFVVNSAPAYKDYVSLFFLLLQTAHRQLTTSKKPKSSIREAIRTSTPAATEAIVFRFSPQSTHSEHLKLSRKPDIFQRSEELQKKKGLFFPRGNASHIRSWRTAMRTVRGSLEPRNATTAGAPSPKDDRAEQLTDRGHQHPPGTPLERRRPTNRRHCRSAQPARGSGSLRPETSSGATAIREGRRRLRFKHPALPGERSGPEPAPHPASPLT